MSHWFDGPLGPYVMLLLIAFLPTEIWRVLSVFFARGLDESSQWVVWVRAVATALLAGVVAKLLLSPSGALASVPLFGRVGAIAIGLAAFFAFRRSILAAILFGESALIFIGWWFH